MLGEAIMLVYENMSKLKGFIEEKKSMLPESLQKGLSPGDALKRAVVPAQIMIIKDLLDFASKLREGSITQNNNIDISVNGTGDPNAIADSTAKALQSSINSASAQLPRNQ